MKQVKRKKWLRILGFWIAFFVLVAIIIPAKNLGISLNYFAPAFGALLIVSRVHSIKGRIKRLPYFFGLLGLLFMLIVLGVIVKSSHNFFTEFLLVNFSFLISYFFVSSLYLAFVILKVSHFSQEILGLKLLGGFPLSFGLLCLGICYPFVTLNIKRLRDINMSGWFSLITLIPGISVLFELFLCLKGSARSGRVVKKRI